ncbi:D-alanyl-D-alanine carboxypeptidase/D-alanyl-D-alanine-endopeptidase [Synechococcus sp. CS-603]|uniref:D-alanyl-D-alanine carboxypeptidase/D-alanyl-D-alanine endopeptidase n=1 Tax=Synechococcus sp. CS-603 TaxID=2847981 RepID=UPI00223BB213|nr:D-alanyl-D-alanine carboxypeptidase/D-alanyl-D-alanine-endopeptidase [Synechococcus sp. CS-603]MCT0202302.1 D-alanyl-D-alanine carboxypeptidase/D-alanyl-D-alanine-endopeptidase [Synechococcus sp. CS-603]
MAISIQRSASRSLGFGLGLGFSLLPLAPLRAMPVSPVSALPVVSPQVGLTQLQNQVSCPALQARVLGTLGGQASVWSVTVADGSGRLLADVNGLRPRVPASNQKLVSTAYALDQLGPDYRLSTRLWRLPNGNLRLTGEGDPDLAIPQLQRIAKLALGSGGGPGQPQGPVRLELAEEPAQAWWPPGWHQGDRAYAYGAPITRLAITSNAIEMAVANPPGRLQRLLSSELTRQGGQATQLAVVPAQSPLPEDSQLLHVEPSAPMHNLLSLANSQSHNFTAEVLLRQAGGSWNLPQSRNAASQWLGQQGLPMQGVVLVDGSGLDRGNRLTSRFVAALLLRMAQHPFASRYWASMSVAGKRGTLRNLYKGTSLDGRFYGKTGTLRGVRSISGVLNTTEGPRYVSLISNGAGSPNTTIGQVLRQVQIVSLCRPPA